MNKAKSIILAIVLVIQLCVPGAFLVDSIFNNYTDGNEYIIKLNYIYIESFKDRLQLSISPDIDSLAKGDMKKYLPLKKNEYGFAIPSEPTNIKPSGDYIKYNSFDNIYYMVDVKFNSEEERTKAIHKINKYDYMEDPSGVYVTAIYHKHKFIYKDLYIEGEKVCDFVLP